jgi:alpha-methylacyl-CoA racemase
MNERVNNLLDGGAPCYQVYRTKDHKYMSVGALEPQFYSNFLKGLGLDENNYGQGNIDNWDQQKQEFQNIFSTKTQAEWVDVFDPLDCCVMPVVDIDAAHEFPHNKERGSFMENKFPRPAPLLCRTPASPSLRDPEFAQDTSRILTELGYTADQIRDLEKKNAISTGSSNGSKL